MEKKIKASPSSFFSFMNIFFFRMKFFLLIFFANAFCIYLFFGYFRLNLWIISASPLPIAHCPLPIRPPFFPFFEAIPFLFFLEPCWLDFCWKKKKKEKKEKRKKKRKEEKKKEKIWLPNRVLDFFCFPLWCL